MDFKKCCSTCFWGGIIIALHILMNKKEICGVIDDIKPKVEKTIDNLKK